MATYTKYDFFIENLCQKTIDCLGTGGTADTFTAIICSDAPAFTSDAAKGDRTQIAGNNGYTTDGTSIAFSSSRTGATITTVGTDVIWTATTGNLGSSTIGRYFDILDTTADKLVCDFDYASTFTVAVGETITLDFGASLFTIA